MVWTVAICVSLCHAASILCLSHMPRSFWPFFIRISSCVSLSHQFLSLSLLSFVVAGVVLLLMLVTLSVSLCLGLSPSALSPSTLRKTQEHPPKTQGPRWKLNHQPWRKRNRRRRLGRQQGKGKGGGGRGGEENKPWGRARRWGEARRTTTSGARGAAWEVGVTITVVTTTSTSNIILKCNTTASYPTRVSSRVYSDFVSYSLL